MARGNVALIGDASGSVDAITGEGLCQAFQQSEALVTALIAGDLTPYAKAHRAIGLRPAFMADFMLSMDRSAFIRRRALSAMSANPNVSRSCSPDTLVLSIPGNCLAQASLSAGKCFFPNQHEKPHRSSRSRSRYLPR